MVSAGGIASPGAQGTSEPNNKTCVLGRCIVEEVKMNRDLGLSLAGRRDSQAARLVQGTPVPSRCNA
jgi:hypothetical protein